MVSTPLNNISQNGNLPQFSGWKLNIFETTCQVFPRSKINQRISTQSNLFNPPKNWCHASHKIVQNVPHPWVQCWPYPSPWDCLQNFSRFGSRGRLDMFYCCFVDEICVYMDDNLIYIYININMIKTFHIKIYVRILMIHRYLKRLGVIHPRCRGICDYQLINSKHEQPI